MFKVLFWSILFFFVGYRLFSFLGKFFKPNENRQGQQRYDNSSPQSESKHFTKDVGEYVSYEEVKDDEK